MDETMTLDEFVESTHADVEPALTPLLRALWHDARGDWDTAHRIAQDVETSDGAWVHAYLHRREGDRGNARYWYHRASRSESTASLDDEWREIAAALLHH